MTRSTSAAVYHQIESEGLLSKLRMEVYSVFYTFGPMTQGEMWKRHFSDRQRHDVCPRVAELVKRGVLAQVGERPCAVTGRVSMVWDTTDSLPVEPKKLEPHKCPHCQGRGTIAAEPEPIWTYENDEPDMFGRMLNG